MPTKIHSVQGHMWDILSKEYLQTEKAMLTINSLNPDFADCLVLSGNTALYMPPRQEKTIVKSIPPWKR